jgi:uncharacterized membrane protein
MRWLHTSSGTVLLASSRTPTHTHTRKKIMFYKLLLLMIDQLIEYRNEKMMSKEFQRDMQDTINQLKKIKKYF